MIELAEAELRSELEKIVRNMYETLIQQDTDRALEKALGAIGIEEKPLSKPRKSRSDKGKARRIKDVRTGQAVYPAPPPMPGQCSCGHAKAMHPKGKECGVSGCKCEFYAE